MHDIDFLPAEYRHRHDRRRGYDRQVLAVALLVVVVAAAAWSQKRRAEGLRAQLAACEPARNAAAQTQAALDELQAQLQSARAEAELVTYLRHPWPRTQILAAILRPLPEEITFEKLHIERAGVDGTRSAVRRAAIGTESEESESARLPPAVRDLARLREEGDASRTVVTIVGVASESAGLHQYLGALGQDDLFSKCRLQSSQADPDQPDRVRFTATLIVRPGYGEPGGPTDVSQPQPGQSTIPGKSRLASSDVASRAEGRRASSEPRLRH